MENAIVLMDADANILADFNKPMTHEICSQLRRKGGNLVLYKNGRGVWVWTPIGISETQQGETVRISISLMMIGVPGISCNTKFKFEFVDGVLVQE